MKIVLALVFLAGTAHAEKDRNTAMLLSGAGAGVSSAFVIAGFGASGHGETFNTMLLYTGLGTSLVTPSLGEWYAGEWFTIGMAIRAGGVGLAVYAIEHERDDVMCPTGGAGCKDFTELGVGLFGVAAIAYIAGIAYDVADAPNAVKRYNRIHATVTPAVSTTTGAAPGLSISGYF